MLSVNLKQQLEAFKTGVFLEPDGKKNTGCFCFHDWFCSENYLDKKASFLFGCVEKFLKHYPEVDQEKVYVFFKNNCPMVGKLYDDFRICDCETGDVLFNVIPKGRDLKTAEIYSRAHGFSEPIKSATSFSKLF